MWPQSTERKEWFRITTEQKLPGTRKQVHTCMLICCLCVICYFVSIDTKAHVWNLINCKNCQYVQWIARVVRKIKAKTYIPSLAFALPIKYPLSPSTIVAKNTSFNRVAFMLTVTTLYVCGGCVCVCTLFEITWWTLQILFVTVFPSSSLVPSSS